MLMSTFFCRADGHFFQSKYYLETENWQNGAKAAPSPAHLSKESREGVFGMSKFRI